MLKKLLLLSLTPILAYAIPPITTTTLTSSANPSVYGQTVTITATVTGSGGPTGSVVFVFPLIPHVVTVPLVGGVATTTLPVASVNSHVGIGTYVPSGVFIPSVGSLTQVVNQASTTTTVTSSPNPSSMGQTVTLSATVAAVAPGAGTPSGTVTFTVANGPTVTGAVNGSGVATATVSGLSVGSHLVTASYAGDINFLSTSGTTTHLEGVPVTIQTVPPGLSFTLDSTPYVAPQTFTWTGSSHSLGAPNQPSTPGSRYVFQSWSDSGAATHDVSPQQATTYTATFVTQHLLTTGGLVSATGGTTVNPSSLDGYYNAGTSVQVHTVPAAGYRFESWDGNFAGQGSPLIMVMNAPAVLLARFELTPDCPATLNRTTRSVLPSGEVDRVELTTGTNCPWTAVSSANWITVVSGSSGITDASIRYQVEANPSTTARSGTLTIAGIPFQIFQSGAGCDFTLNPASQLATASPGAYTAAVTTPSACSWTPVATASWITPSGDRQLRSGSGTLAYTVSDNHELVPRVASIEAGGQNLPILQKAPAAPQMFSDVPPSHQFFDFITLDAMRAVMSGCTSLLFCPDAPVTRAQMAEYVIRALLGKNFSISNTNYFTDVTQLHPQFAYIQKLRELGITSGCTATMFCPDTTVTRGEASVFLIRARLALQAGQAAPPFAPIPYFTDVPANHPFFAFIQKIRSSGVTVGCSATEFCPSNPITKGQMAVFIARALLAP